ncbi:hypothetical protein L1987_75825 [Smallanthus sonchifolius]|uniref:Uncharacterized protein n=1 Tax=Smallanthus sonchifolius TaxID=185202 RepID=A0ACB9A758_9ASTR|nr:hypothetical protein L1987_75825 [Smallanthus sonchifolius]
MSTYDQYSPAPSDSFARANSIEPTTHASQPTAPNISSVAIGSTEKQLPETGERSVPAHQVVGQPPVHEDVRPVVNSSAEINNRGWDPNGGQPQSISDLVHKNNSGYDVSNGKSEARPPTQSDFAERDRSDNGGAKSVNPADYAGISLVGKRFKLVNPEAYYVEKDDPLN